MRLLVFLLLLIPLFVTAQKTDSLYYLEFIIKQKIEKEIDWSQEYLRKEFELKGKRIN